MARDAPTRGLGGGTHTIDDDDDDDDDDDEDDDDSNDDDDWDRWRSLSSNEIAVGGSVD